MKAQDQSKQQEEVVHFLAYFVPNPFTKECHRDTYEDAAHHDYESCNPRYMVKEKVQVALLSPACEMKESVNQRKNHDDPTAIDMKLVLVGVHEHGEGRVG